MVNVGDTVWWNDPDNGIGSGEYTVVEISGDVFSLSNGSTEVEAFAHEIEDLKEG